MTRLVLKTTIFFLLTSFVSCIKSDTNTLIIKQYQSVDERMWPIFTKFEAEAAKRAIFLDLEEMGIEGRIEEIDSKNAVGLCKRYTNGSRTIIIDEYFWNLRNEKQREMMVFHELGHCALGRNHNDNQMTDGRCESIMRSGTTTCQDMYSDKNHNKQYLDELFLAN